MGQPIGICTLTLSALRRLWGLVPPLWDWLLESEGTMAAQFVVLGIVIGGLIIFDKVILPLKPVFLWLLRKFR